MATTAATAALVQERARPGTARQYTAPIKKIVRTATGGDTPEYPPQLPMIGTPYGRGRDSPK